MSFLIANSLFNVFYDDKMHMCLDFPVYVHDIKYIVQITSWKYHTILKIKRQIIIIFIESNILYKWKFENFICGLVFWGRTAGNFLNEDESFKTSNTSWQESMRFGKNSYMRKLSRILFSIDPPTNFLKIKNYETY